MFDASFNDAVESSPCTRYFVCFFFNEDVWVMYSLTASNVVRLYSRYISVYHGVFLSS